MELLGWKHDEKLKCKTWLTLEESACFPLQWFYILLTSHLNGVITGWWSLLYSFSPILFPYKLSNIDVCSSPRMMTFLACLAKEILDLLHLVVLALVWRWKVCAWGDFLLLETRKRMHVSLYLKGCFMRLRLKGCLEV